MARFGTIEEALRAFEELTDEELLALRRAGQGLIRGTRFSEPVDLIHEALDKCLQGLRAWPLHIAFGAFLYGAMRSIAGHDRAESRRISFIDCHEFTDEIADELIARGEVAPSAEESAMAAQAARIAKRRAEELAASVKGDPMALAVISGWLDELSAPESMAFHALTLQQHDAARRRVVRRAVKIMRRDQ